MKPRMKRVFISKQYEAYPQLLAALEDALKEASNKASKASNEASEKNPGAFKRVIDVGGGQGFIARAVAGASGARVWCVDPQARTPRKAKNGNRRNENGRNEKGNVVFVKARGEALPFENGVFDAATLCFSLEYADAPAVLSETRRVLSKGATAFLLFHHPHSFWAQDFKREARTSRAAIRALKLETKTKKTKRASSASAVPSLEFIYSLERAAGEINGVRFASIAFAPAEAVSGFERFSKKSEFAGDWLPQFYLMLVRLRRLHDSVPSKSAAAKKIALEIESLEENLRDLPRNVFPPSQAQALIRKNGFKVVRAGVVYDNRNAPLAFSVIAKAA